MGRPLEEGHAVAAEHDLPADTIDSVRVEDPVEVEE
jgi:hypothetical protein